MVGLCFVELSLLLADHIIDGAEGSTRSSTPTQRVPIRDKGKERAHGEVPTELQASLSFCFEVIMLMICPQSRHPWRVNPGPLSRYVFSCNFL